MECIEKIVDTETRSMDQIILTYFYGFKPAIGNHTGSIRLANGELTKHDRFCCISDSVLVDYRNLEADKLDSQFMLFKKFIFFLSRIFILWTFRFPSMRTIYKCSY